MFNRLKDSILEVLKSRLFVLIVVFCILSAILIQRVFYLQIVKGEDYLNNYKLKIQKTKTIQGTRGVIYDRNGEVLATNKLAYSVQIEDNGSYEDTKQKNKLINKTINSVIDMVEKNGDSIVNDFGIILNSNNEYEFLYLPIFMDIQQLISYRKMKKILRRRKSWIFSVRISVENLGDLVLIRKNTKKNMENPVSFSL